MAIKASRFVALVLAALSLTMTSAHVLELPQKMKYDVLLYAVVNATLYRYFALIGGAYTIASIAAAGILAWLVRDRHPSFEWTALGVVFLLAGFCSWLVVVQPVDAEVARAFESAPDAVPTVWIVLRDRWEYGHLAGFVLQLLGFCALVVSAVIETTKEAPRGGVVHARVSGVIHAPRERVESIYADWSGWPRVFGKTIRGVRLLRDQGAVKTIEVDHVEGRVLNVMSQLTPEEIRLDEWRKRYDATFTNRFESVAEGTRYSVVADVVLKGPLKVLAPIAKPFVRARMKRFVLDPVKTVAERTA